MLNEALRTRRRVPEWMDAPDADPAMIRRSLRFIRLVNVALGYTRVTLHHLKRFGRRWKPDERITILDLGTGSADIPLAIVRWAKRRGFDVHIVAVDQHEQTLREATDRVARAGMTDRITLLRGDALDLPFDAGSFDYVITAMFLHHLDDADAERVLAAAGRIARRGVILSDLLRDTRALRWIRLLTFANNAMIRHDAAASVIGAFSASEILAMRNRAGLQFAEYVKHPHHRFALAGEKF